MTRSSHIRAAILAITKKIRDGEVAAVADEVVTAAGGLEAYIERAYLTARSIDLAKLANALRDAGFHEAAANQLSFDGMAHASVPAMVMVRDPQTKELNAVPFRLATVAQWESDLRRRERSLSAKQAVLEGFKKTLLFAQEKGVTADMTGAEVEAMLSTESVADEDEEHETR